jgi:hypothetical protein
MSSPDFASDTSIMNAAFIGLSLPVDHISPVRRSSRARSSEPDSPSSAKRQRQVSNASLRLPRGVQRQSRNGAAYSGWVTVEGYRLLGPARPTAELASLDRERLAEAKLIGGLPEARKVIQQLHAEVASTRRIKSQYLTPMGVSQMAPSSAIQLRSQSHLSPLTRTLPKSVCVITACGSKDTWFLRTEKLYSHFTPRTDIQLEKGVHFLEFGAIRQTIEEARRDAHPTEEPLVKEEIQELGSTAHKLPQHQESVWGFCAVAELVLENMTAYVGVCIFCDVILTAGPARGSRSSAESDAFLMVSEVLASGISYAVNHHTMPCPNPAEDIFLPGRTDYPASVESVETSMTPMEIKTDELSEEASDDDKETNVPITPSGPVDTLQLTEESIGESSNWSHEDDMNNTVVSTPDES